VHHEVTTSREIYFNGRVLGHCYAGRRTTTRASHWRYREMHRVRAACRFCLQKDGLLFPACTHINPKHWSTRQKFTVGRSRSVRYSIFLLMLKCNTHMLLSNSFKLLSSIQELSSSRQRQGGRLVLRDKDVPFPGAQ